jgi:hypothetical protein
MPKSHTFIVASLHGRSGKTLLARLLADHAILSGETPEIFDTDVIEKKLYASFPSSTAIIDLDKVTNQMELFDTLAAPSAATRIVDVTHRSFTKFFKLMKEIGFVDEARSRDTEPVIFYLLEPETESYAQGYALREQFRDCPFIVVENQFAGKPNRQIQNSTPYQALTGHDLKLSLPALDQMFVSVIDDPELSLSGFTQDPPAPMPSGKISLAYMSLEARSSIRGWLKEANAEITRVLTIVKMRAAMSFRPLL